MFLKLLKSSYIPKPHLIVHEINSPLTSFSKNCIFPKNAYFQKIIQNSRTLLFLITIQYKRNSLSSKETFLPFAKESLEQLSSRQCSRLVATRFLLFPRRQCRVFRHVQRTNHPIPLLYDSRLHRYLSAW